MPQDNSAIILEDYKLMRVDLLQTRAELQKTIVYSAALASFASATLGSFAKDADPKLVSSGLQIGTLVFMILALNYVAHMRHYLAVARYLELLARRYQKVTGDQDDLGWEIFNRCVYSSWLSKKVLLFTQGTQAIIPFVFALLCFVFSFYDIEVFNSFSWVLLWLPLPVVVVWIIALRLGVKDLDSDIRECQTGNSHTNAEVDPKTPAVTPPAEPKP